MCEWSNPGTWLDQGLAVWFKILCEWEYKWVDDPRPTAFKDIQWPTWRSSWRCWCSGGRTWNSSATAGLILTVVGFLAPFVERKTWYVRVLVGLVALGTMSCSSRGSTWSRGANSPTSSSPQARSPRRPCHTGDRVRHRHEHGDRALPGIWLLLRRHLGAQADERHILDSVKMASCS